MTLLVKITTGGGGGRLPKLVWIKTTFEDFGLAFLIHEVMKGR